MCVAAQQNIALSERGRCFFSVMVTVGNKEFFVPDCYEGVFCHDWEVQDHLINFSITVASHAEKVACE